MFIATHKHATRISVTHALYWILPALNALPPKAKQILPQCETPLECAMYLFKKGNNSLELRNITLFNTLTNKAGLFTEKKIAENVFNGNLSVRAILFFALWLLDRYSFPFSWLLNFQFWLAVSPNCDWELAPTRDQLNRCYCCSHCYMYLYRRFCFCGCCSCTHRCYEKDHEIGFKWTFRWTKIITKWSN